MRSLRLVVLAVGATALFCGSAPAQFFLAPGGRGSGPSQLVLREEVQKELKLTGEQIIKVKGVNDKIRKELENEFAKLAELDGRERDRKKMELAKRITKQATAGVEAVLTPPQMTRLKEIALQQAGVQGLKNPEVEDALKLTEKQKEQIQAVMQGAIAEMRDLFEQARDAYEESQKAAVALREKTYAKAMTILTAEQKQKWQELQGKPFTLAKKENRPPNPHPKGEIVAVAGPSKDHNDLSWVEKRAEQWQPTKEERRFDEIGWATHDILGGIRLGQEHNRPVFVFTVDGFMNRGRC